MTKGCWPACYIWLSATIVLAALCRCGAASCNVRLTPENEEYKILPDQRKNITMKCYPDCNVDGEIQWRVHPHINFQKVPCYAPSCINFILDSPSNYSVTCSYGASNATTTFAIIRDPYFSSGSLNITLEVGQREAVINFHAVFGVPNFGFSFLKDDKDLNMSDITSDKEGNLHIDKVKPHHGGTYTFEFFDSEKNRSVNVTVVGKFETPAVAVGAEVYIQPPLDGLSCKKWERDGEVIESNSDYVTSGTQLQIGQVSRDDVGKMFTCVVAGGRVRLNTTLLSRESISVCVEGEDNHHQVERVLQKTMEDELCQGKCFQLHLRFSFTRVHGNAYHVYGVVNSSNEVVRKFNESILKDGGPYHTHGLTITAGNCLRSDTSPSPSPSPSHMTTTTNAKVTGVSSKQTVIVAIVASTVTVVLLAIISAMIYYFKTRRAHGSPPPDGERGDDDRQHQPPEGLQPGGRQDPPPYSPPRPSSSLQQLSQHQQTLAPSLSHHQPPPQQEQQPQQHGGTVPSTQTQTSLPASPSPIQTPSTPSTSSPPASTPQGPLTSSCGPMTTDLTGNTAVSASSPTPHFS